MLLQGVPAITSDSAAFAAGAGALTGAAVLGAAALGAVAFTGDEGATMPTKVLRLANPRSRSGEGSVANSASFAGALLASARGAATRILAVAPAAAASSARIIERAAGPIPATVVEVTLARGASSAALEAGLVAEELAAGAGCGWLASALGVALARAAAGSAGEPRLPAETRVSACGLVLAAARATRGVASGDFPTPRAVMLPTAATEAPVSPAAMPAAAKPAVAGLTDAVAAASAPGAGRELADPRAAGLLPAGPLARERLAPEELVPSAPSDTALPETTPGDGVLV